MADEHEAQDFSVKELVIRMVWLSRGKKQELGRTHLGKDMGTVLSAYKSRKIALHEPVNNFYNRPNEDRHTGFGRGSTQHAETIHISPAAVAKTAYTFVEDTQNDWHSVRLAVARDEVGILPRRSIPGKSIRTRLLGIFPAAETTHGKQEAFVETAATSTPLLHMFVAEG